MSKKQLSGVLILMFLLVGVIGYLGYRLFLQRQEFEKPVSSEKQFIPSRELPDRKSYDPSKYIAPLGKNQETESVFSDKAQVRGVVGEWSDDKMTILVADKEYEIVIPDQVYFKCIPETFTDKNGVTVNMKETFIDFRKAGKGTLTNSDEIMSLILEDSDMGASISWGGSGVPDLHNHGFHRFH
ncbi:MAG: hypothetical protein ABIG63_07245 [Chloroflexota bacterium]